MAKRVRGDQKKDRRGKMAVVSDPLFQLLATRMTDTTEEIMRMLQEMTKEQRVIIAAGAMAYQHAFAQISGACLIIDRSHAVYDKAMKRKPKPKPKPKAKAKAKR